VTEMRNRKPRGEPDQPITAHLLQGVFEKVLRGSLRKPGDIELKKLAAILDHWRIRYLTVQLDPIRQPQHDAKAALRALANAVEAMHLQIGKSFADTAAPDTPPWRRDTCRDQLFAINAVRAQLACIKHSSIWDDRGIGFDGWAWLGPVLVEDFVNAMKPENPTFDPGLAYTGPVARYLKAVVPLVTGEKPRSAVKKLRKLIPPLAR
jgi:hypothetical protein